MTWVDRGKWEDAAKAARDWLDQAKADDDVLESLRARAAIASVAVFSGQGDASASLTALVVALDAQGAEADAIYPPISTELRLYAGLLSGYRGDRAGVEAALQRTQDSTVIRDYPTVAQLQNVVLAEQERLAGKPRAAIARLAPLARQHTALVAVHWALMRAARDAGDTGVADTQANWLATHRGRVFTEATTSEVLRFFNIAVAPRMAAAAAPGTANASVKAVPATPLRH